MVCIMLSTLKPMFVPGLCMGCGMPFSLETCDKCSSARYCTRDPDCKAFSFYDNPIEKHSTICASVARCNLATCKGVMDTTDRGIVLFPERLVAFSTAESLLSARFDPGFVVRLTTSETDLTKPIHVSDQDIRKWLDGNGKMLTKIGGGGYLGYLKDLFRLGIMEQEFTGPQHARGQANEAVFTGLAECAVCRTALDVQACPTCYSMFLCPKHMQHPQHLGACADLTFRARMRNATNAFGFVDDVKPKWPSSTQKLPSSWAAYNKKLGYNTDNVGLCGLISSAACWPMTILAQLAQASLLGKQKLTVHMVGAEVAAELSSDVDYVGHFKAFLPVGLALEIVCVGPSLGNKVLKESPQLTMKTVAGLYEDARLDPPDAVFIFEGGMSFPFAAGSKKKQNWDRGLTVLATLGVPVICTAYDMVEAISDVAHLKKLGLCVTREPAANPFQSKLKQLRRPGLPDHMYQLGPDDMEKYLAYKWRLMGQAGTVFEFCGMAA